MSSVRDKIENEVGFAVEGALMGLWSTFNEASMNAEQVEETLREQMGSTVAEIWADSLADDYTHEQEGGNL